MSDEQELGEAIGKFLKGSGAGDLAAAANKYADKQMEAPRPAANCHYCGKRIKPTKTNKAQSYCDEKCKQAAYRARRRARADHTIVDEAIASRQNLWRQASFSDEMIQRLMTLWSDHGAKAMGIAEDLLGIHQLLIIERYAAAYVKDSAIQATEIQTLKEELEAIQRNAT